MIKLRIKCNFTANWNVEVLGQSPRSRSLLAVKVVNHYQICQVLFLYHIIPLSLMPILHTVIN